LATQAGNGKIPLRSEAPIAASAAAISTVVVVPASGKEREGTKHESNMNCFHGISRTVSCETPLKVKNVRCHGPWTDRAFPLVTHCGKKSFVPWYTHQETCLEFVNYLVAAENCKSPFTPTEAPAQSCS